MDGVILTDDDYVSIGQVKWDLGQTFDITDLGNLKYFLRIELTSESSELLLEDPGMYQRLVGHLIYLTNTKLDLTFAVIDLQPRLSCFTDADYAGSRTNRHFTYGFSTFYGDYLISWKSKKHGVVSRSSVEAKYRAMAQGTCDVRFYGFVLS
ncbi:uncharacterized protein LOC114292397 [Camellia sinensis]|uniref:uncharacterized protein LOC114292397 n=1 Tax=Camellia sinensis TaxID=4442 RepID=UPI001036C437|nr:uncharacterized protein LOC114292397 [Camellia sinensis]